MSKRVKKPAVVIADPLPITVEAFGYRDPRSDLLHRDKPSCINWVQVERYRTTVERIAEPADVYRDRLVSLWRASDNHHHWDKLRATAKRLLSLTDDQVDDVLKRDELGIDSPSKKATR